MKRMNKTDEYEKVLEMIADECKMIDQIRFADEATEMRYRDSSMRKIFLLARNVLDIWSPAEMAAPDDQA